MKGHGNQRPELNGHSGYFYDGGQVKSYGDNIPRVGAVARLPPRWVRRYWKVSQVYRQMGVPHVTGVAGVVAAIALYHAGDCF